MWPQVPAETIKYNQEVQFEQQIQEFEGLSDACTVISNAMRRDSVALESDCGSYFIGCCNDHTLRSQKTTK